MEQVEIKKCPFCGSTPDFLPRYNKYCSCSNVDCALHGKWFFVEDWNHRYQEVTIKPTSISVTRYTIPPEYTMGSGIQNRKGE